MSIRDTKQSTKKNGTIEILRFVFCMAVFLFHVQKHVLVMPELGGDIQLSLFANGSKGVEFFFLVSGYLMAMTIYKKNKQEKTIIDLGKETISFLYRKWISIFPYHIIAFIIIFIQIVTVGRYTIVKIIKYFIDSIPNILFIDMSGIDFENPNYITWYISVMFISMFILYPLCRKYYSTFIKIVVLVSSIIILGMFVHNYDALTSVRLWTPFGYKGFIRGLVEIGLGTMAFEISRLLSNINLSYISKIIIKIVELSCYLLTIIYMITTLPRHYEIFALFALFVGITITFSNVVSSGILNNKFSYFLGKLSLPIYLSQLVSINLVKKYFSLNLDILKVLIVIGLDIIFSVITMFLGDILKNKMVNIHKKMHAHETVLSVDKYADYKI